MKEKSLYWRRLDGLGDERACVSMQDSGYRLTGTIETQMEATPSVVRYRIDTDLGWRTCFVQIQVEDEKNRPALELSVDELRNWWVGDDQIEVLSGCEVVDLQVSPITNTLAIRRQNPKVGESCLVNVAWVGFPDLILRTVRQVYTRLSEDTYRYENLENGFTVTMMVDEEGFVVRYGDVWIKDEG